ncbi:FadR/GntR family transcriptional regulator [Ornithinimicrobium cavernae]|uniref:FadR/GntR family transcriptional regulator n=1 Tax=Ornithinimicrobium cavernae TaxID=2666047 RepID=UPI0013793F05|nr:FadR/GntR family transcriptional regulator [Ornithinimicrobium cavernae]
MFQEVERSRAYEQVVEQIEQAIHEQRLRPGDHLPSERNLVAQFGVGRSTIREALRVLESLGLVETVHGSPKGPRVSSSTAGLRRALIGAVKLEQTGLVDLVQYRMMTGSTANRLAARLRTEEDLLEMEASLRGMQDSSTSPEEFARNDWSFHAAIARASGNVMLSVIGRVVEQAIEELVATRVATATEGAEATRAQFIAVHEEILQRIRDGDGDEAARLSRATLYEVYAPMLPEDERERLRLLL